MKIEEFTKYEKARVLGARALQIAMNAPLLIKIEKEDLEKVIKALKSTHPYEEPLITYWPVEIK